MRIASSVCSRGYDSDRGAAQKPPSVTPHRRQQRQLIDVRPRRSGRLAFSILMVCWSAGAPQRDAGMHAVHVHRWQV